MKHKTFIYLSFFLSVILFACSKGNNPLPQKETLPEEQTTASRSTGATQISGVGFYATAGECDYESQGAVYAIRMTGDLEGCLYAFIDDFECSPSGTYREEGREYFVGTYNGQSGTFWTTYKFEAKYEDCDGGPLGAEIFGRCQHPIVAGSGTGVFNGVSGQINFKDDIEAGNFPYRVRHPHGGLERNKDIVVSRWYSIAYTENKIIKWVAADGSAAGTIIANGWDADWSQ